MKDHFEVGEIALVVCSPRFPEYLNSDCEITHPLGNYLGEVDGRTRRLTGYGVRFPDGKGLYMTPGCLKKKKPPGSYDGNVVDTWAPIKHIWSPAKVKAHT